MASDKPKFDTSTAAKYSSLSASSLLDLQALVSQKESEFASTRHLGTHTTGIQRPTAKSTPWLKQNKGVKGRQERDQVQYEQETAVQGKDPRQVRDKLEKKARLYEKIRKGKSAGLTEAQISNLLVDFDARSSASGSDSEEDESSTVPIAGPSDPLVEWTDEFGRTRLIPRSEIPRGTALPTEEAEPANVHYGDQHHFPVYTPDPTLLAARRAAVEAQTPLVQHYDSTTENRQRGAGFMAFSKDEEERERQMSALKAEREQTERKREELKEGGGVKGDREREREMRKRKVEEKRKELELKRRKVVGGGGGEKGAEP